MGNKETRTVVAGLGSIGSAGAIEDTQWTKYRGEKGGHGFSAEDANALNEKLAGKKTEKVGLSNELNGADRITDGKMIQTKYYSTPKGSIEAGFDETSGQYRYKDQILEVPSDQYDNAVEIMRKKIEEGKVPGCKDPDKAKDLVKKGDTTYAQARNIARAGNIDSLWFDVKNQAVVSSCAFGISFIIQYANGIWNGLDTKQAFKNAFCNALQTGAVVLIVGVGTQQLLRTGFGRSFAALTTKFSREMVSTLYKTKIGKDIIEKMASSILKKTLHGAAAKNTISKLMRSNLVTATVTAVVLTAPDAYKAIISKRISWAQFGKNVATTVAGIGGGLGGAAAGAAIGTAIFPGVGTAIGGFLGGILGGLGGSMGVKAVADAITPDDAEVMMDRMNDAVGEMAIEYMLTESEFSDIVVPVIEKTITAKWLQSMLAYSGARKNVTLQKQYVRKEFEGTFESALQQRSVVVTPKKSSFKWMSFTTRISILFMFLKLKVTSLFPKREIA